MLKVSPQKGVIRFGKRGKLNPRYNRPFKILKRVGPVAYKLELPEEIINIHSTFHVSNLKKCLFDESLVIPMKELRLDDKLILWKNSGDMVESQITLNSIPTPQESKFVNNDKVIAPGMFRINSFKPSTEDKYVPTKGRASVRTNPITVSQPHVITKKDVNSDSNGLSSTEVDNIAKTRRPQPRSNTKTDRVPSASKSSCSKNKEVEVHKQISNNPYTSFGFVMSLNDYRGLDVPTAKLFLIPTGKLMVPAGSSWFLLVVPAGRLCGSCWSAYDCFVISNRGRLLGITDLMITKPINRNEERRNKRKQDMLKKETRSRLMLIEININVEDID
ncbi:hypothetical protein Tco_0741685 [Tanacetum coccineum]